MMMNPGRRTTRSISPRARATSGRCSRHLEGNDCIERPIPKRKVEGIPGDCAQRRRAAAPRGPDRRRRKLHRNCFCIGVPGQKILHRDRRARTYLEHRQVRLREHGIDYTQQPVEVRRRMRRLLKRISFVALVKRGHGGAYLRIRQCRRQLGVESVARRSMTVSTHFWAYTTNPSGNFVRLELNCATSGLSRFRTTRLRPPALMISQIT